MAAHQLKINTYAGMYTHSDNQKSGSNSGPNSRSKLPESNTVSASTAIINMQHDNQAVLENYDHYLKRKAQNIIGGGKHKHNTPSHGNYHSAKRSKAGADGILKTHERHKTTTSPTKLYNDYGRGANKEQASNFTKFSQSNHAHKSSMIGKSDHRPPRHQFSEHIT